MKFNDAVGSIDIDTSHLKRFLTTWFRKDDLVTIVGIPATGVRKVMSFTIKASELHDVTPEMFDKLSIVETDQRRMNVYVGINPTKEENTVTLYSRGDKSNVRAVYGCFIDLDVVKSGKKLGVFESKDEIYSFLKSLDLPPTMIIDNGANGGVHAYWRLKDEDIERADESLLAHWWAYISSLSPVKIDRLIDKTRISRLPSGIYWPSDEGKFDNVKVVMDDGPLYSLDHILNVSEYAYNEHNRKVSELRMQKTRTDIDAWNKRLAHHIVLNDSRATSRQYTERQVTVLMYLMDDYISNHFEWSDILEPYGWTFLRQDHDGSGVWARPGQGARSAVVDYQKSDGSISGVMSLLSSSDETLLADLKEAGVPLTKKQVLLRLKYNDDVVLMVDDLYTEVMNDQANR